MKNKRKQQNSTNNANADIFSTVSIVDGDEVVKRNNNEYIYLDAERGIIAQPEEVETVKNRQAVDVLKNLLLGSFNAETGKYEISNNIELELKEIVKVETSHKGNSVFCESLSAFGGLGKLQFVVKTSAENGDATSQLFIFERVKKMGKTVVNTQIQLVAQYTRHNETYTDFDSLTFENYYRFAWEYFKIVKQNQMFYLSEDEKFLQGWIIRRKLYLKSMGLILNPYIDAAESELLLTRIEILSGLGTYGYKVVERFEELKNQAKKIIGDGELSARDQNEILEEAIETYRGQFEKEQAEFFKKQVPVVKNYTKTIADVKEQNHKEVLSDIEARMPTVVEIIKRDDETRRVGAKARLDAEVASIEASARPTTQQVAENAKQAAEQAKRVAAAQNGKKAIIQNNKSTSITEAKKQLTEDKVAPAAAKNSGAEAIEKIVVVEREVEKKPADKTNTTGDNSMSGIRATLAALDSMFGRSTNNGRQNRETTKNPPNAHPVGTTPPNNDGHKNQTNEATNNSKTGKQGDQIEIDPILGVPTPKYDVGGLGVDDAAQSLTETHVSGLVADKQVYIGANLQIKTTNIKDGR